MVSIYGFLSEGGRITLPLRHAALANIVLLQRLLLIIL